MEKAIQLETGLPGLFISIGDDGLWMNFSEDGKHASINLSLYAARQKGDIIGKTILDWCIATAKRSEA